MVAESNPARRRRRRFESADAPHRSQPSRRRRGVIAALVAAGMATIVVPSVAASAGADPLDAVSARDGIAAVDGMSAREPASREAGRQAAGSAESGLILRIAPTASTTVTIGAPLFLEVEIVNATAEALAAGTVRLSRSADPIDDTAEVDEWVGDAGDDSAVESPPASVDLAESESRALTPGSVGIVSFALPATALDDLGGSPLVGLAAELLVGTTVVATAADVFAATAATGEQPLSLALAYPLTVPNGGGGLFDAEQLAAWTSPVGLLTRQLEAVSGRSVAIAVDPRIIASIRVLGLSAPPSAITWLDQLRAVSNEIFPLAYADADVAVQAQVALPALLTPTSFDDVLDPADFAQSGEEGQVDDDQAPFATPAATATPTPPAGELPTTEALLAWPYTRTDIAWPADDTVAAGNLAFLAANGLTTSILAPGNVEPTADRSNAAATIDGTTAVVADARITAPLREASEALTDTSWRSAAGRLEAELALVASSGGETTPATVLATFARGDQVQAGRVAATIDELASSAWAQPTLLSAAIGAPPTTRTLVDLPEADTRRASVQRSVGAEAQVAAFATVLEDPRLLTGPNRRDLLALLDVAWLAEPDAWNSEIGDWLAAQRSTLGAVSIVPGSPITVVSSQTGVPTTLLNTLPYPVTVVVDVDPSNGRLIVDDQVTQTIEAESRSNVVVPVAAGVGNGEVVLTVSLSSPEGVPIGSAVDQSVNVQADWEGLGAAILGIVVVLVFGIGVWRNIRRRRQQRAADAAAADASDTEAGSDAEHTAGVALEPSGADEREDPRND
ncbi:DUF6049 family protein [Agromyces ramosus]|uniref:2-oxoglutarate dehydrogenase n=1 Tax=Agromyces ramosus TaxID=33879 RepID=A0ABU0R7J2_9MICO|nr:DUF6049 family protein [Agromyces ramosus]MDQ0894058.1 hypothetical protein [Agromyces ramosus]